MDKIKTSLLIFIFAFILRGVPLGSPLWGISQDEISLIRGTTQLFSCTNEGDCFLPVSLFFFSWPKIFLTNTLQIILWARVITLTLGMVTLILSYLLFKKILKDSSLVFFALFTLVFCPQLVFLSKFVSPLALGLPLLLLSIYLMVKGLHYWQYLVFSQIFSGLALFSSAYALVPSLILLFLSIFLTLGKKKFIICLSAFFIFLVWFFFNKYSSFFLIKRSLVFFSEPGFINAINSSRGILREGGHFLLGKILYNKLYFSIFWLSNLFRQYSLANIFSLIEDSGNSTLFTVGPMLIVWFPFFVWGVLESFKYFSFKKAAILLLVLFLAGIPASLLSPRFNQDAFVFALFPMAIYLGIGLSGFFKKRGAIFILIMLFTLNFLITTFKVVLDFKQNVRLKNQKNYLSVIKGNFR
ncbi:MAG: hypothetical protein M1514_02730 [Patescibacteria group bacterium]|nr:hypothetical protein [Patescibacteria group bacterium]